MSKKIKSKKIKAIFQNPELCNFGEQGVWFDTISEGYDDIVRDRNVTTVAEGVAWLSENYNGDFDVTIINSRN